MKTNYFIIGAAVLLFGCGNKMLKEAEQAYHNEQFSAAARMYEKVLATTPDDKAMLHLADCYRQMNKHADAEKWYQKSINSTEASSTDKLHYAEVLKEDGKYQEAIAMYDAYLTTSPSDSTAWNQRNACNAGSNFERENPFYAVEQMNLNFPGTCFSPVIMGKELLVTAAAPVKVGAPVDSRSGNGFLDLYVVSPAIVEQPLIADNGTDGHAIKTFSIAPISGEVNSNLHEGSAALSPSGNILYFTRSLIVKTKKGKKQTGRAKDNDNHLEICSAELVDGNWVNVQSLPFNNTEYSVGQPALSSNGTRMYFVSDIPGGFGGTDIYYSDFSNGTWSNPTNAGNTINTNGNEMFPTIRTVNAGKEEFYFSSDGWAGAGGLDLFKCSMSNGIVGKPERLLAPFNSSNDDFGIVFNENGQSGYFSSNRKSENGDDHIYSFMRKNPLFFVDLTVVDKESKIPVPGTEVEVMDMKHNTSSKMKTDNTGHLIFPADSMTSYGFTLRCSNFFCGFNSVNTGGFEGSLYDTTRITVNLEKIVINKPIRLENIYYDYNKWNIRPDAAVELDKLVKIMKDNPEIKIELSSHTDSRGGDKFNMTLSQKRAQSAVDYIVSKGVSKDRITAKGYGESVPLNRCVNNVKCSDEEFQLNRRTEFKVTSIIQQ